MSSIELFDTAYTKQENISELSAKFNEPEWMKERREKSFKEYQQLPLDKDTLFYKYSNFKKFDPTKLSTVQQRDDFKNVNLEELSKQGLIPTIVENESGILSSLSDELKSKGVFFDSLHKLIQENSSLASDIVKRADDISTNFDKLGSLSKAFANNILVLYVPRGINVTDSLLKVTMISEIDIAVFSEFIIVLEENAIVNLIETFESRSDESDKMYSLSQTIILEANSRLQYSQIQNWDNKVMHLVARISRLGRYANLKALCHLQGGYVTRHNSNVDLAGDGSEGYDLFAKFGNNRQRFDVKSQLHHNAKDTIGHVHARTVMMGRSESILRGLMVIAEPGVNADSWLTSRGMTVGKGRIVAIPALDIDQNDVKAAHAASVEPLNQELVFYLKSRGIFEASAREMLVKGYFEYIIKQINEPIFQEISRSYLATKWESTKE